MLWRSACDADAAREEQAIRTSMCQVEVILWLADGKNRPDLNPFMHRPGTATRLGVLEDLNEVSMRLRRVVAERVLPRDTIVHVNVDVCPRREGRQRPATCGYKLEAHDVFGLYFSSGHANAQASRHVGRHGLCISLGPRPV